ncbi:MAG: hypothetical protein JXB26_00855 [Candidatus Aminicenantes bacterium]|nr:hypothetical protein [Candidatus Aminicenantes bacterium]
MVDIHCHILPGLDDGAQDMSESIKMAHIAKEDGIQAIIATPHIFRGTYNYDDLSIIEQKSIELAAVLDRYRIDIRLFTGAEVHLSHNLIDEIRRHREHLTLANSSYMFVEFPSDHVFQGVKHLIFDLMSEGITPVIAHPERNTVFIHHPELLFELVTMGALAQANAGSFTGLYGSESEAAVLSFLELNLIHFIATDGHNTRSMSPRLSEACRKAADLVGEEQATALVSDNPRHIIENRDFFPAHEPINPASHEKKLKIKLPRLFRRK